MKFDPKKGTDPQTGCLTHFQPGLRGCSVFGLAVRRAFIPASRGCSVLESVSKILSNKGSAIPIRATWNLTPLVGVKRGQILTFRIFKCHSRNQCSKSFRMRGLPSSYEQLEIWPFFGVKFQLLEFLKAIVWISVQNAFEWGVCRPHTSNVKFDPFFGVKRGQISTFGIFKGHSRNQCSKSFRMRGLSSPYEQLRIWPLFRGQTGSNFNFWSF